MRSANLPVASRLGQLAAYAQIVLATTLAAVWLDRPTLVAVTAVTLAGAIVVGETTGISRWFENASGMLVALGALAVLFIVHAVTDTRLLGEQPWYVFLVVVLVPIGLDWRFSTRLRARVVASGLVVVPLVGAASAWSLAGAVAWFLGALVTLALLQRDAERAVLRPARLGPPAPTSRRYAEIARTVAIGLVVGGAMALLVGDPSCTSPVRDVPFGASDVGGGSGSLPIPLPPIDGATPSDPVDPDAVIVENDGRAITLRRSDGTSTRYEFDAEGGEVRVTELDDDGRVIDEYSIQSEDIEVLPGGGAVASRPEDGNDASTRWWPTAAVAALLALLAAGLAWWWRRRHPTPRAPTDWAHGMAARLAREGRRRGRARAPGESVASYAQALAGGPLPDERVATVGRMVSDALFSTREPDAPDRAWAEAAVDEMTARHPARRTSTLSRLRKAGLRKY
jgi:hypothetical protein